MDAATLVCARVEDQPEPVRGALIQTCGKCKVRVWVSPASIANIVKKNPGFLIRCAVCAMAEIKESGETPEFMPVSRDQLAEIKGALTPTAYKQICRLLNIYIHE